jgi:hypothetical protein
MSLLTELEFLLVAANCKDFAPLALAENRAWSSRQSELTFGHP